MRPTAPTHTFVPLLSCSFFWPLVLSHVSLGALTDLKSTHILCLQGPPGWAFKERTVPPLRADLAPERAGRPFSPPWTVQSRFFAQARRWGWKDKVSVPGAVAAVTRAFLGPPPPALLLKPGCLGCQRDSRSCPVRRCFPGPRGWPSSQSAVSKLTILQKQISRISYLKVISM